ncbi:MAG TPA: DUF371 domain-containing protein [Jatrophihabitans sp.]|nr:DUF371 domain-containing protein [Jatrophihabitans sp.]
MRFVGRGSPSVRATHTKTLELTPDRTITERATCVVAVETHVEPDPPLAGPVRIRVRAGGESFTVHARANSSWTPGGPAVIRRSALRLPGTFATHADAAAADLPRSLVAALTSPETECEVTVEPVRPERDTVVLLLADATVGMDARLRAEQEAADVVLAEDADARLLVSRRRAEGAAPIRTLVVATRDLPGGTVLDQLRDPAVDVETVGLAARFAAAAAAPSRAPLVFVPDDADARDLLRNVAANARLVVSLAADRLPELLDQAGRIRGRTGAVVAQEHAPPQRVVAGQLPALPSRETVACCLYPAGSPDADAALDPRVRAAVTRLVEDGVPTRSIARVIAELTGRPRSEAYALALELGGAAR